MNNKEKQTRKVTFKEDYYSKAGKELGEAPIYRKSSVHAIHEGLVSQLQAKGAKMEVGKFDFEAIKKRHKKQLNENRKKAASLT